MIKVLQFITFSGILPRARTQGARARTCFILQFLWFHFFWPGITALEMYERIHADGQPGSTAASTGAQVSSMPLRLKRKKERGVLWCLSSWLITVTKLSAPCLWDLRYRLNATVSCIVYKRWRSVRTPKLTHWPWQTSSSVPLFLTLERRPLRFTLSHPHCTLRYFLSPCRVSFRNSFTSLLLLCSLIHRDAGAWRQHGHLG